MVEIAQDAKKTRRLDYIPALWRAPGLAGVIGDTR
jgi:hypothetical protein